MKEIPLNNGKPVDLGRSPGGALTFALEPIPLLKGERIVLRCNDDYTQALVFKVTPYEEEGTA